ncbi:T9SS type A sorting domain-containing protein [Marivirga sp. S37H4]|uniref:T9SS type A sorting domain-containing protein n=1 Tax=Marivirga aurantiaca TaxID=2802615 RepID=A0A935C4V0_9BACT|nr:T9SS type A sorting domain-containing protein [Marivirga aurantiaca]MBK6263484.1 T9SS type A sorting domain-containing protein [Marivirga aurantiaca]
MLFKTQSIRINLWIVITFSLIFCHVAKGQNAADYTFSAENKSYSPITGGTIISNNPSHDDEYFASQSIGFDFGYLGSNFTQVGVSTNGFITLGTNGDGHFFPISENLYSAICGLSGDLTSQTDAELRIETLGSAPNRICVIQWSGYRNYGEAGNYNFQIRLYETINEVEFHYGSMSHSGNDQTVQVGLNGNTNTDSNHRTIASAVIWTPANTINATDNNYGLPLRNAAYPEDGLSFSFYEERADLSVDLSVNSSNPCVGEEIIYQIDLSSSATTSTGAVSVLCQLPAGLTFIDAETVKGSYDSGTGIWDVGTMADDEEAILLIRASINADQGGSSLFTEASISNSSIWDPFSANNTSNLSITVKNNALPEISSISDQTVGYNQSSSPIPFTISDLETAADDLIFNLTSSNTTTIPLSGLEIQGTGGNKSLVITPGLNQFGTSTITIEVSDGICSSSISFSVVVFKQTYSDFESAQIVVGQMDFNTTNTTASQIVAPGSNSSAVSAKGVLAVGSQTKNRVLIWNSVPTANGTAANIVIGQSNFTDEIASTSTSGLRNPDGVAFSPDGNKLIVADAGNNRILIWNTIPTTNNQPADVVIGQSNFTNNTTGLADNRFNRPTDVQVTPNGKMIVTDRNNNRVLIFNSIPTTDFVSADLVIGQSDFTSNTGETLQNRLRAPWNTSLARNGKLIIADDGNNRILIFNSIPTSNGANADVVIGQTNFTSATSGSTADKFNSPGVTVSPSGVVAVADYFNHRVSVFNEIPSVNGASADIVLGQPDFTQNVAFNDGAGVSGTPTDKNMSEPYGINFDLNERLFVNGRGMHRMMVFGETPDQESELALTFSTNNATPCVQSLVSYTVNIINNGPSNATNVTISAALPVGFTLEESTASTGDYNEESGYWSIPFIGNGETVSLELSGKVNTGQNLNTITAYASVRSYDQSDTDYSNNSGNVVITVADNVAPVISEIDDVITDYNTATDAIPFTITDAETLASDLNISAQSSNITIVPNANISISGTGENRTITLTPANDQFGTVRITLTVDDGFCSTDLYFDVFVGNVWLGYSNEWNTVENWSAFVPASNYSVFIPSSPIGGNFPVINSDASVNNIGIANGAVLTINATRNLDVYGDFYNDGVETTGNGNINMVGSSSQDFKGLVGGLAINNVNGVTMNGETNIKGVLDLISGNLTVGNNTITIRNIISGTSSNLITNSTSSLIVEGSVSGIEVPGQINHLNNLSLDNGNGLTLTANLIVDGELSLDAGSLMLNSHDLTLNGNVTNSTGDVSGNILSNITITGSGDAGILPINSTNNSLNNFLINRSGGSITLRNNLKISGTLTLSGGIIVMDNGIFEIENSNSNAISSFSSTSFVDGKLRRSVLAGQNYDFPVGSADFSELVNLRFNSISEATSLDAEFVTGSPGTPPADLYVGSNAVDGILNYGYWTISPTNVAANINYDISITSIGHTNGVDPLHHVLLKRANSGVDWGIQGDYSSLNEGGSFSDPITVSRANLAAFSDFSIGASSEGPLPISLNYFKGKLTHKGAELNWKTSSELNNDFFEIQKSEDGRSFKKIGLVKGNGTTDAFSQYTFVDKSENSGTTYYRFKQVDYNGEFAYSPIVSIDFKMKAGIISLYPNPVKDDLNIHFDDNDLLSCTVSIYNSMGALMLEKRYVLKGENEQKITIDLSSLPSGFYQLQTISGSAIGPLVNQSKIIKK